MGFEVTYHFHEKIEGDYNKDEKKTFKKKVGDPFEEVSLEKLAGAVMAQLARRDVWIVDIEVFELSKKPISFKETKGGIVLKNKKFLFDGGGEDSSTVIVQDMVQSPTPQHFPVQQISPSGQQHNQGQFQNPSMGVSQQPHEQGRPRRPIDWVVFSPELHLMPEIRQKNLRLTPDKKYPIFEKKDAGHLGEIYVMQDDTGREQSVSDKYFIPASVNLVADRELGFSQSSQQKDGGKLYWGGANNEPDMPDIRRR
jgi:hypothetical protein